MKPAKSPSVRTAPVPAVPVPQNSSPAAIPVLPADEALPTPNERDQSINMTPEAPDAVMKQASKDTERGLKDTSNGPELNAAYAKQKR